MSQSEDRSQHSKSRDIEEALRAHPGVQSAAVIVWEDERSGEGKVTAYVVPNDDYVDRVLGGSQDEGKRLHRWRKTYDLTQLAKEAKSSQPGFDVAGWNSSYTRRPIPADEMKEWVAITVREIASFHPAHVLELGCGTGLLLLRLAPQCERYVGIDFAQAVLQKLELQMEMLEGPWDAVTLLERSADNFEGLVENSFDTVIINSVAQYFPNLAYFAGVLKRVVHVVKPGGRIFVGDLRNLALLEPYAVSIELYQASSSMSVAELRERVRHRIRFEEQLLISPTFFLALRQQFPKISSVEIRPKQGRFDNEMTRFRYDAILHLGTEPDEVFDPPWEDWADRRMTLESTAERLKEQRPEILALKRVPNRRVESDLNALASLARSEPSETVGAFKKSFERFKHRGVDPHEMCVLGAEMDYHIDLSWAASRSDGSYDVVFHREAGDKLVRPTIEWPQDPSISWNLAQYANSPGRAVLHEKLMAVLREYSREHLKSDMVPAAFIALDALPLTADGALNLAALPPLDFSEA
jgi:SAM-dependent methyltransferase